MSVFLLFHFNIKIMQKELSRKELKKLIKSKELVKNKLAKAQDALEKCSIKATVGTDMLSKIESGLEIERQSFVIEVFEKRLREIQQNISHIITSLDS